MIKVYVKINNNYIIEISSEIFIEDKTGWIKIDEGEGDKYSHASSNYLDKSLMDMKGRYNYKYVNGQIIELTEEEKENSFPAPVIQKTELEIAQSMIEELRAQVLDMGNSLNGIVEMITQTPTV